jgi:hypothetical protein
VILGKKTQDISILYTQYKVWPWSSRNYFTEHLRRSHTTWL